MSRLYTLSATQSIPASVEEVWDFMSSPVNLREIAPAYMGFRIMTPDLAPRMYPGMIISYQITPLLGISMNWVTEITHVTEHAYFVDEQRYGPYRFWHHQHFIRPIPGGVEMKDLVHYKVPMGWIGDLANTLFVRKQLEQIFAYRYRKIEERFGRMN